jgi:hypothetical protein
MDYKYKVGQLRASQILFTYGIGSIADLLNLSVMIMGMEEWDTSYMKEIREDRLLIEVRKELNTSVKKLLSPPLNLNNDNNNNSWEEKIGVPVAPFPSWMVCPLCRLLAPLESQLFQVKENKHRPEQTRYVHPNCINAKKNPPTVIPVRFLVACEQGHLDEFPWLYFVHQGNTKCQGPLRLEEYGVSGSTTEIFAKCDSCGAKRV